MKNFTSPNGHGIISENTLDIFNFAIRHSDHRTWLQSFDCYVTTRI